MKRLISVISSILIIASMICPAIISNAEAASYVPGDANSDGKVTVSDVSLILRHIAKWETPTFDSLAADVTADGSITLSDATLILKHIAKWNVKFMNIPDDPDPDFGTVELENGTYTGRLKDGVPHGEGTLVYTNGNVYAGEFVDGVRHGSGVMTWSDGSVYTGSFAENKLHGLGVIVYSNGIRYEGQFTDGSITGQGTIIYPSGITYTGELIDGYRNGYGVNYSADGIVLNTGIWSNGEFEKDHYYMISKGIGSCEELIGKTLVYFVFLNDAESSWDEAALAATQNELITEMKKLKGEADEHGAELSLFYRFNEASIEGTTGTENNDEWKDAAAAALGYSSVLDIQNTIESETEYNSVPVIFVLNKNGRAASSYRYGSTGEESTVLYTNEIASFRHELFHIYGMRDLYYPDETEAAAEKHLPGSVMLDPSGIVDEFTAYIIGWTDTISDSAKAFLDDTAKLTFDYIKGEADKELLNGYGTKEYVNAIYTGYMKDGIPHGKGVMTWDSGDCYDGNFVDGARNGYGVYTWASGKRYEGNFVDNMRHGEGTYYDADGSVIYDGLWNNGTFVENSEEA
ncbi:MAG: hypothetical protein E7578_06625 [Ruminococcaceae bacterium]|nr:hypothetical protein [Oscillospiraceae bacterium]